MLVWWKKVAVFQDQQSKRNKDILGNHVNNDFLWETVLSEAYLQFESKFKWNSTEMEAKTNYGFLKSSNKSWDRITFY